MLYDYLIYRKLGGWVFFIVFNYIGCFLINRSFKWYVFVPVFLLFFSYVFGVAVEVLGAAQIVVRVFVLGFCIACVFLMNLKVSVWSCSALILFFLYAILLYFFNGSPLVLNFVYLCVVLFYLTALKISSEDFLFHSLLASLFVVIMYVLYLFVFQVDLGPVVIGDRARYYFGFTNPNKVGVVAYSLIVLSFLYFYNTAGRRFFAYLFIAPFVVVIIYSDSRTALYAVVLFVVLTLMPWLVRFRRGLFLVPVILLAASFYIAYLYDDDFANSALSYRPVFFYEFIREQNFYNYFFGGNSDGYIVDNSYILMYFALGPLGFLIASYFIFCSSRFISNGLRFSFVLSILAYGLMESILVRVEFPVVIYFYYLIVEAYKAPSMLGSSFSVGE